MKNKCKLNINIASDEIYSGGGIFLAINGYNELVSSNSSSSCNNITGQQPFPFPKAADFQVVIPDSFLKALICTKTRASRTQVFDMQIWLAKQKTSIVPYLSIFGSQQARTQARLLSPSMELFIGGSVRNSPTKSDDRSVKRFSSTKCREDEEATEPKKMNNKRG